ncbi:MAG: hypothetical protein LBG10_09960 [Treponema sp.]|jgi:hypothetical protein|nr:hypothetical protein [Treponema sp.]
MKNMLKILGLLTLAVFIGGAVISCPNTSGGGGNENLMTLEELKTFIIGGYNAGSGEAYDAYQQTWTGISGAGLESSSDPSTWSTGTWSMIYTQYKATQTNNNNNGGGDDDNENLMTLDELKAFMYEGYTTQAGEAYNAYQQTWNGINGLLENDSDPSTWKDSTWTMIYTQYKATQAGNNNNGGGG